MSINRYIYYMGKPPVPNEYDYPVMSVPAMTDKIPAGKPMRVVGDADDELAQGTVSFTDGEKE